VTRALLLVTVLAAVRPATAAVTEVHYVMGTYFRITADDIEAESARAVMRRCFATAREFEARFSRFDAGSELSRLNATANDATSTTVSAEMAALLRAALRLQTATRGTFDVSAGALTHLWRTASKWPSPGAIAAARATAGGDALALRGTTVVRRPGVSIDLDGIAKGWAVDRCVEQLRAAGIGHAFLSFGESSLYALGAPTGMPSWTVLVRGPDGEHALGVVRLKDQAVSVSAVFGHERRVGARRIGHIVDPRSGLPLLAPATAVVVAGAATTAEAFSKAVLVDGGAAGAAVRAHLITGALCAQKSGVQRVGRVVFTSFRSAQPIAAAAEPLR
jgi:thiamine biosynthesis lipoprotein